MTKIDTEFFLRCILTLEKAYFLLLDADKKELEYDLFRSACIKEFEIILEQSGSLLKKCLKPYFPTPKAVDRLMFKDIYRHAAKHGLLSMEETDRWLEYRDNRNHTAHDYGISFAEHTLKLLPVFINDAKSLEKTIREHRHD